MNEKSYLRYNEQIKKNVKNYNEINFFGIKFLNITRKNKMQKIYWSPC